MPAYRAPDEFYTKMNRLVREMEHPVQRVEFPEPKALPPNPVEAIVTAVNGLMSKVAESPVGRGINRASERLPHLRERPFTTPFGRVKLPEVKLPEIHEVELDEHKREALKATVGIDAAQVFGLVPVVGDALADVIEDVHNEALRDTLNDSEIRAYTKYDKLGPSTLAMARTFMRRNGV